MHFFPLRIYTALLIYKGLASLPMVASLIVGGVSIYKNNDIGKTNIH